MTEKDSRPRSVATRLRPTTTSSVLVASRRCSTFIVCALLLCGQPWVRADQPVDFQRQIAPILVERCLSCHGPSSAKGGLDLSQAASALKGGDSGTPILPGHPDQSLLVEMITPDAPGQRPEMPQEGDPLSVEQIALVRRWITAGATWPNDLKLARNSRADKSWWSLRPLGQIEPPMPAAISLAWARHPIDQFVYAKLIEKGLRPSPPADKRTLIRRVTFDLTGLPPSPAQIEAFLRDDSPRAYERLVDRLLESPRYGERWGRHWLDVIRFGESSGYERNHIRDDAWPFRDYVIRSLNEDKPFDQFVLEQLAGDQLAPQDPRVEVGTGYLVAGSYDDVNNQDPAAKLLIRANTLDDIISTTGAAFLGLTINCARCHDHKFDPIEQADYYRVQAAFAGVQQGTRVLASAKQKNELAKERKPITDQLRDVERQLASLRKTAQARIKDQRDELIKQLFPRPPVDKYGTEEVFDPVAAKFVRLTVHRTTGGRSGVVLDEFEVFTPQPDAKNVALADRGAIATVQSQRYSNDDPEAYGAHHLNDGEYSAFWISGTPGGQLTIQLAQQEIISRVFWSVDRIRAFSPRHGRPFSAQYDVDVSLDGKSWTKVADHRGRMPLEKAQLDALLLQAVLTQDEQGRYDELSREQTSLQQQLSRLPKLPTAWIGSFQQPSDTTYLMSGGDPMKRGPLVAAASLRVLDHVVPDYELTLDAPEGKRRLALATWITHPENPLTLRVMVNRIWHYHFGRGIVATPSDFGYNGARPTHPQLLDWLARQVRPNRWQWKAIHKLILTSQTYQQSSRYDPQMAAVDVDAHYLWRFPPQRLSAESIRDSILAVAGKLDLTMGGPGFRLYQYTVDNVATYFPLDQVGPQTYRRAVYHQNPRSVKVDVLGEYDMPECSLPAPTREITTSPLQALALMNHSFMIDMSQYFAERVQNEVGQSNTAAQVERAYQLAFGRPPENNELAAAESLIDQHGLIVFCRALFNANEMVYIH